MGTSSTRIVVVDDHTVARAGIVFLLSRIADTECVGEAWDRASCLELIATVKPDLVLMDIKLGATNGIALTREIKLQFPEVKIVALTMCDELEYIVQMEIAGASGYLLKTCSAVELQDALVRVSKGRKALSSELTEAFLKRGQRTGVSFGSEFRNKPNYRISRREQEILTCVSREMSNKEIGEALFISPRTVENHKRNLFQKLGVKNSIGLLRKAMELSLVS